ncbi:hypothetical protein [Alteromonas portus]|uniref:hypothetical protein n=1 Tax=Alteromonas portus TaxID=2565549 RepID=UPI003BF79B0B
MKAKLAMSFFLTLLTTHLAGCAHFIAYQIASQHQIPVRGNVAETFKPSPLCSTNNQCIYVQRSPDIETSKLEFALSFNNETKIWTFKDDGAPATKNKSHLIFVFPGFGTPKSIVAMHQLWLGRMTGAEVIVVESADSAEHFSFGLNAVAPIVSDIKRKAPVKVDLVGISMGSVAAQHVASNVAGAKLHLIAPMTDFHHSTLALWNILHKDKIYSSFISTQGIEDAIALVYKNAKTKASDIDIIKNIKEKLTETYVYTSSNDRVALELDWEELDSTNVTRHSFSNLNHLEMSSLMDEELLARFISNLMDTELETSLQTTGLICRSNQQACVKD